MDIESIVKKYFDPCAVYMVEGREAMRAALTELAAEYDQKLADMTRAVDTDYEQLYREANERIRQLEAERDAEYTKGNAAVQKWAKRALEAERVSEGWNGWRDVAVHGYPEAAQEVLFVHKGKTVHGAFIGEIFWHSNEKCVAALWRPLPTPLNHDEWRSLLAAATQKKEGE